MKSIKIIIQKGIHKKKNSRSYKSTKLFRRKKRKKKKEQIGALFHNQINGENMNKLEKDYSISC